ncbi:hypothetical protein PTKIN_Ptkin14bG0211600 [Pterospermum kingtungense]
MDHREFSLQLSKNELCGQIESCVQRFAQISSPHDIMAENGVNECQLADGIKLVSSEDSELRPSLGYDDEPNIRASSFDGIDMGLVIVPWEDICHMGLCCNGNLLCKERKLVGSADKHAKKGSGGEKSKKARRKLRKPKRGVNELIYGDKVMVKEVSDSSISDEEIIHRNEVILREAEANVESFGLGVRLFSMKVVSWNIRGLGRAEKMRAVRRFLVREKFDFIAVQETKLKEVSPRIHRWLWGNETISFEVVVSDGNSGGLISVWRNDFFSVDLKYVSQRFILLLGTIKRSNFKCGIGNVYAPNNDSERLTLWKELQDIIDESGVPWCLTGDFNVVRTVDEKIGFSFNQAAMDEFSGFINTLGLIDLPLVGGKFTWSSNRESPTFCRLDRFLIAAEFLGQCPYAVQKVWPRSLSDHNPISLEESWAAVQSKRGGNFDILSKLRDMKGEIKAWVKQNGNIASAKIKELEEEIHALEVAAYNGGSWDSVRAEEVENYARLISCKSDLFPAFYLGLPIGAKANMVSVWDPVIRKCEKRLAGWRARSLSMGGRLTLINSILSSLPNYYLSLFQIPVSVKNKLEMKIRRFLWGGSLEVRRIHWVNWNTVCKHKSQGGIGIMDLSLKNHSLLNKWFWRFADEKDALWRKIIVQKYGGDCSALLPDMSKSRSFSSLSKNIMKPLLVVDDCSLKLVDGMGFALGNGVRILFWSQEWIPGIILKFVFPRIYNLAICKDGSIDKFGVFEKAKSFCLSYLGVNTNERFGWSKLWNGYLPPKVEIFCWQLIHGKSAVKANLMTRNILQNNNILCPLCGEADETVSHLFFSCSFSWKVWYFWCGVWEVQWVSHCDPWFFFVQWNSLLPNRALDKMWGMLFGAVAWSIWLCRNEVVFKGKNWELDHILDLIKLRLSMWMKARWLHLSMSMLNVDSSHYSVPFSKASDMVRKSSCWIPPSEGMVKFNVDGSSFGKPDPVGIGGVLRNHKGNELMSFSKHIGMEDSNVAEIMAIREALVLFLASPWVNCSKLIIESDSRIAIGWVNNPNEAPWKVRMFVNHITNLRSQIKDLQIFHIFREANQRADQLAKKGAKQE